MHLHLTESSARPGMQVTAEAEREYWMSRQKAAVKAPAEIDVHAFHDALGLMYPLNWSTSESGGWETFMLQEMVCGDVTEIYARYGARYFRLRDVCNLSHAQITTRIKEEFNLFRKWIKQGKPCFINDAEAGETTSASMLIPERSHI